MDGYAYLWGEQDGDAGVGKAATPTQQSVGGSGALLLAEEALAGLREVLPSLPVSACLLNRNVSAVGHLLLMSP